MLVKMMQEGVQQNKDQAVDRGRLQINVTSEITAYPIENATISISYTGVPNSTLEQLQTNQVGQTEVVELDAPPLEYSLYYASLLERLQKILDETKNDWIERKIRLNKFIKNHVEDGAANEASDLGLDEKEFAFFKVVKKYLEDGGEEFIAKEEKACYISDETVELSKHSTATGSRIEG